MNEVKCYLTEAVKAFGSEGDHSLEYIGLSFDQQGRLKIKIYRTQTMEELRQDSATWKIWEKYFQEMGETIPLKLCDISNGDNTVIPTQRMVVRFINYPSREQIQFISHHCLHQLPKGITERFETYNDVFQRSQTSSALQQLGIEVDTEYRFVGLKYYLNLPKRERETRIDPHLLFPILQKLKKKRVASDLPIPIIEELISCQYIPSFVGINDFDLNHELKIYFISTLYGRSMLKNLFAQIIDISNLFQLESSMLVDALYENHLYVQGIALSSDHSKSVRIYLRQIPQNLVKYNQNFLRR